MNEFDNFDNYDFDVKSILDELLSKEFSQRVFQKKVYDIYGNIVSIKESKSHKDIGNVFDVSTSIAKTFTKYIDAHEEYGDI